MRTNESNRDSIDSIENGAINVFFSIAKILFCIEGAFIAGHLVGSIFDKCTGASKDTVYASKTVEDQ